MNENSNNRSSSSNSSSSNAMASKAVVLPAEIANDKVIQPFLDDVFDTSLYASAVLRSGSASSCTQQLNTGIAQLDAELRGEVVMQYDALLEQVTGLRETERALATIKLGVKGLKTSTSRVSGELAEPHKQIEAKTKQLEVRTYPKELPSFFVVILSLTLSTEQQSIYQSIFLCSPSSSSFFSLSSALCCIVVDT